MSAFVVSKTHIDVLVRAAREGYGESRYIPGVNQYAWNRYGHFRFVWDDPDTGKARLFEVSDRPQPSDEHRDFLTPDVLGQMLIDECCRSVYYRYADVKQDAELPGDPNSTALPYRHNPNAPKASAGELALAVNCYEYQSCEHPGWRKSKAYAFCVALQGAILRHIPGYEGGRGWDSWDRKTGAA